MATNLTVEERMVGGGRLVDTATGLQQAAVFGQGVFPSRTWRLGYGTGSGQGNQWYLARRTVNATTADNLDLAGVLTNLTGTITFSHIKRLLLRIVSPDGTKKLQVGPRNQANAWQGPWGGTGATVYEEVVEELDKKNQFGGWAVTAGSADVLGIYNPGATAVTYAIWIIGRQ